MGAAPNRQNTLVPSKAPTRARTNTDKHGRGESKVEAASVTVRVSPWSSVLAANAALSLLNLACRLLDRQIAAQAAAFEREGGFTERLYRVRKARRDDGR